MQTALATAGSATRLGAAVHDHPRRPVALRCPASARNGFMAARAIRRMVFGLDPVLLLFLGFVLAVVLVFYLIFRRTFMAYREGSERGRR